MSVAGHSLSTLGLREAEPVDFDKLSEQIAADSLSHLWGAQPPEWEFQNLNSPIAKARSLTPPPTPKAKRTRPNLRIELPDEEESGSPILSQSGQSCEISVPHSQCFSSSSVLRPVAATFKDMYASAALEDWDLYRELCLAAISKLRKLARKRMSTIVPNRTAVYSALGKFQLFVQFMVKN